MAEITFDPAKLFITDIDLIRPNDYNPKDKETEEYKKVKESIEKNGLRLPIVVREISGVEGYEIIDGEQRWRVCKELNFEKVIIYNEGNLNDQRAKELTIWYQQQVPFNEILLAKLVTEMASSYKDLALPFSEEEVLEMKELVNFDWDNFKNNSEVDFGKENETKTLSLTLQADQYEVIMQAIASVKKEAENNELSNERALELLCSDYLAGH
ncbi:MAG: ParB/RepB/Spo0J family partition protein [Candidatus Pacebacteria bacterium]|nr:ParB/RepB/Spo0J family partition protein [Candidatus Paceibacterota bacterium]